MVTISNFNYRVMAKFSKVPMDKIIDESFIEEAFRVGSGVGLDGSNDYLVGMVMEPESGPDEQSRKSKTDYVAWLQGKLKRAAILLLNLMETTEYSPGLQVVRHQLIKSATSTAANYRAACRARSANEFYAKICIVVEEADETQFWLEILLESELKVDNILVHQALQEWTEIVKIVTAAKTKSNPKK